MDISIIMNRLFQYGSVDSIPYYNCSWKSFEEWEKTGVKRPYMGYPMVIFGIFIELLYLPVIYIIFTTKLIRHPCYKLIVMLAMIDMCATSCSCLITGSLLIVGGVFCMYPTFTYIAGGFVLNTWCMACSATVSLFINRIISIAFREYADVIEKKLAYLSIGFVISYGMYIYIFTPSIAYNSVIMAWLPDPLSEQVPSPESAAMIFIQCSIICFFNTGAAMVYNSLIFVTPSPWILIFGQLCWCINHACPAIIYITMNNTIRREFKRMVFGCISHKVEDTSTANKTASQSRI